MYDKNAVRIAAGDWEARVLPDCGMNTLALSWRGEPVLRTPPDEAAFLAAPETFGTPPLLPPCRTAGAAFTFDGVRYALPENDPAHRAHKHGYLYKTPFCVTEQAADAVSGTYENTGDAFPFPFRLTIRCTLIQTGYLQRFVFDNTGARDMPLAFGLHTAFLERTPLRVPLGEKWVLDADSLPTGARVPLDETERRIAAGCDPGGLVLNGAYASTGRCAAFGTYRYEVSEGFTQWVLWNGGGGKGFFCIEPLNAPINALNAADCPRLPKGRTVVFWTRITRNERTL